MTFETASEERVRIAAAFLREAVFRSRAKQTLETELLRAGDASETGNCGLGAKAAVVLDLSPEGERLRARLWPNELVTAEVERIRGVTSAWVRAQDALDRKRNHFLKAFRHAHGFDRRAYPAELLADYESGLAKIAAEEDAARRAAALELLVAH